MTLVKNKTTGEIGELEIDSSYGELIVRCCNNDKVYTYHCLAALSANWEDCEASEPAQNQSYWCIDWMEPGLYRTTHTNDTDDFNAEIGNHFATREEAEKALEKLKAWERLRDAGFRFKVFYAEDEDIVIRGGSYIASSVEMWKDLDLLFGGEE